VDAIGGLAAGLGFRASGLRVSAAVEQPGAEAPTIEDEIENADGYAGEGDGPGGKVGVDESVKIVKEKSALVWGDAGQGFEMLLGEGERTGPGTGFDGDSPEQSKNMQRAPEGPAAREKRAEDDQRDPDQVRQQK
jgi:hypothetical protein